MYPISTIGVASGLGGAAEGCREGPLRLLQPSRRAELARRMGHPLDVRLLQPNHGPWKSSVSDILQRIATYTRRWALARKSILVLGGDHSCALGTWGGVLQAFRFPSDFGLIWIDAHMDAHNFDTTPSGNLHGMPLAGILGVGDARLQSLYPGHAYLHSPNVHLMGVRSYESAEADLLKSQGVEVWDMEASNRPVALQRYSKNAWIGCDTIVLVTESAWIWMR